MAFPAPVAAALSGATVRQLSYWRTQRDGRPALLLPEYGVRPRVSYSYRDVVALRMFGQLREELSLQKIRKAVTWLQEHHPETHLSAHSLKAEPGGQSIVWISEDGEYVDVVRHPGQQGITVVMEDVFASFVSARGKTVPDLREPAAGLRVDPGVRGGYPVIEGTRIPYDVVEGLRADGVPGWEIIQLYPGVASKAIAGAEQFAELVAGYEPTHRAA